MKKALIACTIVITSLISCQDESSEASVEPTTVKVSEDSVEMEQVDTVLTAETLAFFNQSGLTSYAQSNVEGFDWSKFRLVNVYKEDSMVIAPFTPDQSFLKNYGPFLKYSPDKTKFIDLDSYNIDISSTGNGQFIGHEKGPDNEVSLIDLNNNEKKRLIFLGPGGSVEDGSWIDNETLVLVGVHDNAAADSKTAVVWKYHLPTNTFFMYEMPDPISAEKLMGEWRKERLKSVKLE